MKSLKAVLQYAEGSLILRAISRFFAMVKSAINRSFILGFFVGDYTEAGDKRLKESLFVRFADTVFNRIPKVTGEKVILFRLVYALPLWGLVLLTQMAVILPTMTLAYLMILLIPLTILTRKIEIDRYTVVLLVFVAFNLVMSFFSLTRGFSVPIAVIIVLFMFASITVPAVCNEKKHLDFFIIVFVCGAAITGLVGIYQAISGQVSASWIDTDIFTDIRLRVFSTLENPNVYASYLLLAIPLSAVCVVYFKNKAVKVTAGLITALLIVNLFLTYSRGGYLALAVSAGLFILIMEKRFIFAFIPMLAAMPFFLPQSVINRFMSIINFAELDTSTVFRLSIYESTLRMLRDFWMAGVGQGGEAYNQVYLFYALAAIRAEHAHNTFLQTTAELGILGLLLFIALLATFIRALVNFIKVTNDLRHKAVAAAMISAVAGYFVFAMFDHVFYNYRILLSFYIFMGIGIAFTRTVKSGAGQ